MKRIYKTRKIEDRFWEKVKITKKCWNWKGKTNRGYGMLWVGKGKSIMPHIFSYRLHKGEIPKGLQIDHLCRNRKCMNPEHLEAVTLKENVLRGNGLSAINSRKTHCKYGHIFDVNNTLNYRGQRHCRKCKRDRQVKSRNILRNKKTNYEKN